MRGEGRRCEALSPERVLAKGREVELVVGGRLIILDVCNGKSMVG